MQGFVGSNEAIVKDLRQTQFIQKVGNDVSSIDFILWLQIGNGEVYQETVFLNNKSLFRNELKIILKELNFIEKSIKKQIIIYSRNSPATI